MTVVEVALGRRSYPVVVGSGATDALAATIAERAPGARRAAVVTQAAVAATPWFADLVTGLASEVYEIGDGEAAKSLTTVEQLCRAFARSGLTRADLVVAVGGGVVSDVAGFAAAVYHRGIRYATVASTLLAQVDAAVGGKTGVNLPEGKNLVGAFWQPVAVWCDTDLLDTLPAREWTSGRGEMAKYAFLGGAGAAGAAAAFAALALDDQVAHCVGTKAAVVAADEREGGTRAVLNYGHTLAHALEAAAHTGTDIRHGEAVAVGILFAALLARRLGRIDDARVDEHREVLRTLALGWHLPAWAAGDPDGLVAFMARDKKAVTDLTFVLDGPRGLEVVVGVGADAVRETLDELARAGGSP